MIPATAPATGEVHLWLITLADSEHELAQFERLLSPDELSRANRLLARQARNRFVAGRGFLRITLAHYLDLDPEALLLNHGEQGKPYLAGIYGEKGLKFSLSHTGNRAILAVTSHYEIGVDLEEVKDNIPFQDMARRYFSHREQTELFSLPAHMQLAAFYRCWTRKEAYMKGCGTGFSQPSNDFDVSLLPGQSAALLAHHISPNEVKRWKITDISIEDDLSAALATEGCCSIVFCNYVN